MQHVVLVRKRCLDAILAGEKRVESRLTVSRRAPFGLVEPGHLIYFKETGGPFRARALAERVEFFETLTPEKVRALAARFEPLVLAGEAYWSERVRARYASFVWLAEVRPVESGPAYRRWRSFHPRSAWIAGPPPLVRPPLR
jgi:ASC-1-like (ASCH) protein